MGWAKDLPREATLALVVDLDREAGLPDEAAVLRDAIHEFFSQRAQTCRRRLRELLRLGRTSLVIGLIALASVIALGDFLAGLRKGSRIGEIVLESFTIGGWVSMWRPLEIFLYDWWPIRDEARLSDLLAATPVRIRYLNVKEPGAWRGDWPEVSPRGERARRGPTATAKSGKLTQLPRLAVGRVPIPVPQGLKHPSVTDVPIAGRSKVKPLSPTSAGPTPAWSAALNCHTLGRDIGAQGPGRLRLGNTMSPARENTGNIYQGSRPMLRVSVQRHGHTGGSSSPEASSSIFQLHRSGFDATL
jgi:hypothetical protein